MLRFVRFCTQNTDKRRTLAITFPTILSQTCISSLLPLVNENVLYHSLSEAVRKSNKIQSGFTPSGHVFIFFTAQANGRHTGYASSLKV
jgi:hypothetical protein